MKALREILLEVLGDKREAIKSLASTSVQVDPYMTVKPIETSYSGCIFRSRIEARWAIFFDAFGLKWNYESEGYHLGNGSMYLPDFTVKSSNGMGFVFEVKHSDLAAADKAIAIEKIKTLVVNNIADFGLVVFGQPDLETNLTVMRKGPDKAVACHETTVGQFFAGDLLSTAIQKSKSARFEHGESGAG